MTVMPTVKPGDARHPGVTVQDVIRQDKRPVPEGLKVESYTFLGNEDIPYERYISSEYYQAEMDKMWTKVWQWACREEHIPESGDYIVYDIGKYSVLVVRTDDGSIKAYRNACMHRGTKLKPSFSEGSAQEIRCPYHGWTWDLEGGLQSFACEWDFPHVDKKKFGLSDVRVETWGGFVFINLDHDAMPLLDYLDPLPKHFDSSIFEDRYIALHIQKELNCNWKIASEAFLESYHSMETHTQLMSTNSDVNTQYDFFGDHVNRLIQLSATPSPLYDKTMSEQQLLDCFFLGDRSDVQQKLEIGDAGTARGVMAEYLRDAMGKQTGRDLSGFSDVEMIDTTPYFVFPNQQFFTGVSFPIVYRFRPMDNRHDRTLFDFLIMKLKPKNGHVEPAMPVRKKAEESYGSVPGMDPAVAHVFDQDTSNMEAAQEGYATSEKPGATLANYQEIRIRHMHQTLEKYLNA